MKPKQLDENTVVNELTGSSLFFVSETHSVGEANRSHHHASAAERGLEPAKQAPMTHETATSTIAPSSPTESDERRSSSPSDAAQPTIPEDSIPETNIPSRVDGSNEPSKERSNEPTNVRTNPPKKVRHTFDIRTEQLLSLKELAVQREVATGERTLLGDLVQEALDLLIAREAQSFERHAPEPTNERSFVRTMERTNEGT